MTTSLVVVGAGGFGRETLDVIEAINRVAKVPVFDLLGVVDSDPSSINLSRLRARNITYLGSESDWLALGNRPQYLVGIGNPTTRQRVHERFDAAGLVAATAIHPNATVGSMSQIAEGTVICSGAEISTNVKIGRHVHINPNATVGHDSILNEFVSVNPASTISGEVSVGAGTLIGAGATVLQGLAIGSRVVVGASACVVKDVPDGITVKGVPAR
ncbi:acetyltransferase [Parafrigoribacterium soli]|uniref:acetyltransferase n=1 Tax=Parafrigoribacterium soli TaxID=3144663 RepID=UPI0032F037EB